MCSFKINNEFSTDYVSTAEVECWVREFTEVSSLLSPWCPFRDKWPNFSKVSCLGGLVSSIPIYMEVHTVLSPFPCPEQGRYGMKGLVKSDSKPCAHLVWSHCISEDYTRLHPPSCGYRNVPRTTTPLKSFIVSHRKHLVTPLTPSLWSIWLFVWRVYIFSTDLFTMEE